MQVAPASVLAAFDSPNILASTFQLLGILIALAGISMGMVQKLFGMVTYVPDQVITWVGGHAAKFGHDDSQEVRQQVAAVGAHLGRGAGKQMPKTGGGKPSTGGGDHPEADKATTGQF